MDIDHVTALFNRTVRAKPSPRPWMPVERIGSCVRLGGPREFLLWWDLTAETAAAAVADQASHARRTGKALLWRVYDFDRPTGLADHLQQHGFTLDDTGTLMFLDLARAFPDTQPDGVVISRATTPEGLDDFIRANAVAFGEDAGWQREAFAPRLNDPELALYVAYVAGRPVGAGRLDMNLGDQFGHLFGGGVAPGQRRRGIYQALVAARVAEARRLGRPYLATEARDTSRPILQSLGFVPVAGHTT